MSSFRRSVQTLLGVLVVLVTCIGLGAAASAQPTAAPMEAPYVPAHQLINVKTCNPKANISQSGGYVGYVPGYYGYRGGYWGSVYGPTIYEPPVTTANPQLGIDYVNISSKPMTQIEFGLIANGHLVAEVKDVGTFTPGAEIKHKFGLSPNVFPLQTGLPQCVPLRITFSDGTKWRSNRLPPRNAGANPNPHM